MRRKLLVVDLEATCWERHHHRPEAMEIIEIGALLIDPEGRTAPSEFQTFIRPIENSTLSAFCTELTTIRQEDVDQAEPFPEALTRFVAWSGSPELSRFASWGAYDRNQFRRDCERHQLPYPFAEDHLNIKHFVAERLGVRRRGVREALTLLGLELEGTHHRGLDDARNIWRILAHVTGGDLTGIV